MENPNNPEWGNESEGSSPFDLKVLVLYGVFRSKYWVVALGFLGLVAGLIFGASQPNVFESTGLLQYTGGVQESLTEESLLGITPENQRLSAPGILDEIITLDDPALFESLAEELGSEYLLSRTDPSREDGESTPLPVRIMHQLQSFLQRRGPGMGYRAEDLPWLAKHLRSKTKITAKTDTYMVVSYQADTPEKAQAICGKLLDAFVQRHRDVYGVEARLDEQREKVQNAFDEFRQAQTELIDYRKSCGVYDYEAEFEKNQTDLTQVEIDTRSKENELEQVLSKIEVYREKLAGMDPTIEVHTDPVMREHPQRAEFNRQLYALLAEEIQASTITTPMTQQNKMEEIRRRRAALEAALLETPKEYEFEPARVEFVTNGAYWNLDTTLTDLLAMRESLVKGIQHLRSETERLIERRDLIDKCRGEHFYHGDQVQKAQNEYDEQTEVYNTLLKLNLRDESGSSNLKMTQHAGLPLTKVGPNRWKPLAGGIVGGLFLGVACAVLRQLLDRRVRYPEVVEKNLGLRVLGVVPETRRLRTFPKSSPAA